MIESLLEAFAVLFVTLSPVANAVIFADMSRNRPKPIVRKLAVRSVLISTAIMTGAAFFGDDLLRLMGIQLSSLEIAGGILLLLLAIQMVMSDSKWGGDLPDSSAGAEFYQEETFLALAVYPLALPLIAGPDAIVSIVLLMSKSQGDNILQGGIILILFGILGLTLICFLGAKFISRVLGKHGGEVVSRLMGVILAALAVEFIVNGLDRAGLFRSQRNPGKTLCALSGGRMAMSRDLTAGPVGAQIRKLSVPVSMGFLFNTLYNMTDIWFSGRISTDALAALSLSFPVFFIIVAVGVGSSIGGTALTGSLLGSGDRLGAARNAAQTVSFGLIFSIPVSLLGIQFTPMCFRAMGATGDYLAMGCEYMNILFMGSVFLIGMHMANSGLTALGDTRPFRDYLVAGFFLNCLLDPWFIHGGAGLPAMGLAGVAVATVLVHALGCAYMFFAAKRAGVFTGTCAGDFLPRPAAFLAIARQALPACFNYLTIAAGIFVVLHFISRYGQAGVAACGVAVRIEHFCLLPAIGLNTAVLALSAQNHGAGRMDRVRDTLNISLRYGFWLTLAGTVILLLAADKLMAFFTDDPEVVAIGGRYLRVDALALFAYVMLFVNQAVLQGMKHPQFAMWMGVARQIVAPWAAMYFVSVRFEFGLTSLWWVIFGVGWSAALVSHYYARRVLAFEEARFVRSPERCGN